MYPILSLGVGVESAGLVSFCIQKADFFFLLLWFVVVLCVSVNLRGNALRLGGGLVCCVRSGSWVGERRGFCQANLFSIC